MTIKYSHPAFVINLKKINELSDKYFCKFNSNFHENENNGSL